MTDTGGEGGGAYHFVAEACPSRERPGVGQSGDGGGFSECGPCRRGAEDGAIDRIQLPRRTSEYDYSFGIKRTLSFLLPRLNP